MNNLNRETAACIVDLFEDFLDAKGIKVENEERDEHMKKINQKNCLFL